MKPSKRKVVTRSPGHTVRLLSLPHLQPVAIGVDADSALERDFVHLAALYPWIESIQHQPFLLELVSGNYTPDFLLSFKDGSRAVVEVKPKDMLGPHLSKLADARKHLQEHGLHFVLALDVHIQKDDRAERALRIRRYAKTRMDEQQTHLAMSLVEQREQITFADLQAAGVKPESVAFLLTRRRLEVGADLRMEPETIVRIPDATTFGDAHAVRFDQWLTS
jgi:hypothetical protein